MLLGCLNIEKARKKKGKIIDTSDFVNLLITLWDLHKFPNNVNE